MNDNQKMTIKDVAKYCGVSATTVSRVVNGTSYVSPELKKKILDYIGDCGWQCGGLRHKLDKKNSSLKTALIVDRWTSRNGWQKCYENQELLEILRESGFEPIFSSNGRNDALQKALIFQPSLVIVNAVNDRLSGSIRELREAGIPVVAFGNSFDVQCPCFMHDLESAGRTAVRLLRKNRPERIGVLAGIADHVHPNNMEEIPVREVHDLVKGISVAMPEFDLKRDLVSDCFHDYSEFKKMFYSGKYTHWIVCGTEHYLAFAKYLEELDPNISKAIRIIPILESESIPVPLYFRHALIRSSAMPLFRKFMKKNPSGNAEPQEIAVPFHQNGE